MSSDHTNNSHSKTGGERSEREEPTYRAKLFNDPCGIAELIKTEAPLVAKSIKNANSTQIRKFYDEVANLKNNSNIDDFTLVLPSVYMLASQAAYAKGRKLINDSFMGFIQRNVRAIQKKNDLETFALYFEAVYGYYKFENNQKDSRGY